MNTGSFGLLRKHLTQPPSWQVWNRLVQTLDQWPDPQTRPLALEYTREHLQASWPSRWRVANGQWDNNSIGWSLLGGEQRLLDTYPLQDEIWCPPGTFSMGASQSDTEADSDEKPAKMTLTHGLWVLSTPVTEGLWQSVYPAFERTGLRVDLPMTRVRWVDAVLFCNALSRQEGLEEAYEIENGATQPDEIHSVFSIQWKGLENNGYRLLTEAEWEYLCRAGMETGRYGQLEEVAWFEQNSHGHPHPVAQKLPNAWGLYDMLGNVYEWTQDTWQDYWTEGHYINPFYSDKMETRRVIRGGSWHSFSKHCRASYRNWVEPFHRSNHVGFRIARRG